MTPRLTNTAGDDVVACPECDTAGEVWKRDHPHRDFDKGFACYKCGAKFDEPNRRPAKTTGDNPPPTTDEDDLPHNLSPKAKELIRRKRGD